MKRFVTILIILAAAGGGGYYYYTYGNVPEKPQVVQVTVSQGNIVEVVQATGTLEALRVAPVGSQVSGVVKSLYADFNSIVTKDQIIAELDPSLLQVQVDLTNAAYERQVGEIANQEVQLENDKKNLERTQAMYAKGLTNQQALDQAELQVKTRATQVESAKKTLKTQEASLNQAKLNLSYTIIRSPIDGVVVNRFVDIGQTVQSSMQVAQFFTLATDLRTLKLNAPVDEAEIGKVRPGMPVTFTVDSYIGTTFEGVVDTVRLNAQNANNVVTYPVWISVPNNDLKLRPAMTATVRIRIAEAPNATRIPNAALRFRATTDMYNALGLTPPAAGRGLATGGDASRRGRGEGGATAGEPSTTNREGRQAGAPPSTSAQAQPSGERQQGQDAAQGGQPRRGRGQGGDAAAAGRGTGGGQGFGGGRMTNMSAEDRQKMMADLGVRGGGRGAGRGGGRGGDAQASGRGGQGGGRGGGRAPANADVAPTPLSADKIDELFQPTPARVVGGQVYTWDEANRKLTQVNITIGLRDDQFSQLVTGDIKPGQQLVSNIIIPLTTQQRNQQNSLFGPQRGGGGMQPGQRGGDQQQQQPRGGGGAGDGFGGRGGGGGFGGGGRGGG